MKNIFKIFKNDFKNYTKYRILHMIVIVSILFSLAMGILPQIEPLLFVYLSIFIIPVITHSITTFVEREENEHNALKSYCLRDVIAGKLIAALALQLISLILYLIVMYFVLNMHFNLVLFLSAYILGLLVHIVIGTSITIITKTDIKMSVFYCIYIVIFSLIPFIYLMNLVPESLTYLFIFSPAYLSSVLIENIVFGYLFSDLLLIIIACLFQIFVLVGLICFIIKPYYKNTRCNSEVIND